MGEYMGTSFLQTTADPQGFRPDFANEGWHKWHPDRHMHNMYTGPESHPNNPYFPAASPGYGKVSGVDALGSANTDVSAASSVPLGNSAGGTFAGGAQTAT